MSWRRNWHRVFGHGRNAARGLFGDWMFHVCRKCGDRGLERELRAEEENLSYRLRMQTVDDALVDGSRLAIGEQALWFGEYLRGSGHSPAAHRQAWQRWQDSPRRYVPGEAYREIYGQRAGRE